MKMGRSMFLKLDGVRGNSMKPGHVGSIEISGFTWGNERRQLAASIAGPGKITINDLTIFKPPDVASPPPPVAAAPGLDVFKRTAETPFHFHAFLADPSSEKRNRKIDELLERPGYAAWWATRLSDWTGNNARNAGERQELLSICNELRYSAVRFVQQ